MAVTSEIVDEREYLLLRCSGTCTSFSEVEEVFLEALAAAERDEKPKVLIDAFGVSGDLTTMDRYEAGRAWAKLNNSGPFTFTAFAIAGKSPLIDPSHFGETVARNRGMNARVFNDLDEAVAWITDQSAAVGSGGSR